MKALFLHSSLAILISLFAFDRATAGTIFSGSFSNWEADGAHAVVSGGHTPTLAWGDPGNFRVGASFVSYTQYAISTDLVLSGQPFALGRVTFFNGTIRRGTGISSATLFLLPSSDNDDLDSSDGFSTSLFTKSTPNVGTGPQNADYLFFSSFAHDPFVPPYFNVDEGSQASADLIARRDFIPGFNSAADSRSGSQGQYALNILGFENPQGNGFLTFVPIDSMNPEPSSLILFSIGMLPALLLSRRGWKRT